MLPCSPQFWHEQLDGLDCTMGGALLQRGVSSDLVLIPTSWVSKINTNNFTIKWAWLALQSCWGQYRDVHTTQEERKGNNLSRNHLVQCDEFWLLTSSWRPQPQYYLVLKCKMTWSSTGSWARTSSRNSMTASISIVFVLLRYFDLREGMLSSCWHGFHRRPGSVYIHYTFAQHCFSQLMWWHVTESATILFFNSKLCLVGPAFLQTINFFVNLAM